LINVKGFLYEVKKLVSQGRRQFVKRKGYKVPDGQTINYVQALLELDIADVNEAWEYVLNLTPAHYHSAFRSRKRQRSS
jgi:hypothetical protein